MSIIIAAAALLMPAGAADTHVVRLEHRGAAVDVTYRSDARIAHRQLGAVGAPGRPNTLRCAWAADVSVRREARHARGTTLVRSIAAAQPLAGSRPGWCAGQRAAIAADVAARSDRLRAHLLAVAAQDRAVLAAELDAAHDAGRS